MMNNTNPTDLKDLAHHENLVKTIIYMLENGKFSESEIERMKSAMETKKCSI